MLTFFLSSTHQLDILLVMIQTTEALLFQLKRQGYRNPQTKIHAVLCRNWTRRIKGRDLYDYVWYLSQHGHRHHENPLAVILVRMLRVDFFISIEMKNIDASQHWPIPIIGIDL